MIVELKPCPFCGAPGKLYDHGYSDEYCFVGCSNDKCTVHPSASSRPKRHAWDEKEKSFWVDWENSEIEAAKLWNIRAVSDTHAADIETVREALEYVQPYICDSKFHEQWIKTNALKVEIKKRRCPTCGLFVANHNRLREALAALDRLEGK